MSAWLFWLSIFGIAYTYAGYPLLLAILAYFRPGLPDYPSFTPSITLLIAAYNEEVDIKQKLENSLALDYPADQLQILVADDGSDDDTVKIVKSFARQGVELSSDPQRKGKMSAINRAMKKARGEIIVLSDANAMYDMSTLRALTAPFSEPKVGAVIGAKIIQSGDGLLGDSEGAYWKYESWISKQETRLGYCTVSVNGMLAIRKKNFEFPPENIINDDFYILMGVIRKGYRSIYAPQAHSIKRISHSAQDEMIRRTRMNAGRYQAIAIAPHILPWRHPLVIWQVISHKFLRPLVPFGMILAFLANLASVIWPAAQGNYNLWRLAMPFNWIFLGLQSIFYLLAWLGNYLKLPGKTGRLMYITTFLVNSNLAALMGLIRYITRQQSVIWKRVQR